MENNSDAKRNENGPILTRRWGIHTITGEALTKVYEPGKRMLRLDFVLLLFSPSQLTQCTLLTNIMLRRQRMKEATTGEILNFFGSLILLSKFGFCKRSDIFLY